MPRKITASVRVNSVSLKKLTEEENSGEGVEITASGYVTTGDQPNIEEDRYFPVSIQITRWAGCEFHPSVGEELSLELSYSEYDDE